MTKSEKLLPCPFCGGRAEIVQAHNPYVMCMTCHVSTPMFGWKKDAIAAWNRRTDQREKKSPRDNESMQAPGNG